jgi:hypothetical protein
MGAMVNTMVGNSKKERCMASAFQVSTTARIPLKQRGESNNQPNDGAAWRLGAMVNGNGMSTAQATATATVTTTATMEQHGPHLTMVDGKEA